MLQKNQGEERIMLTRRRLLATTGGLALTMPLIQLAHAETQTAITFGPPLPVYALSFVAEEKGFFM
jgi:ABC-type nitrate/sulfonate/bicarbonate transport system substrate-binding protein